MSPRVAALPLLCALPLLAAAAAAQSSSPVAYPQATTNERALISWPLGYLYSDAEARYQLLVPSRFLPSTGGRITGIEVVIDDHNGPITYKALNINLAHSTASSLDQSNMPGNLPSPHRALTGTDLTLSYTQRAWSPVAFQQAFTYDGRSNVVIEFQKAVDPAANPRLRYARMMTTATPLRTDLPPGIIASGSLGSGAFSATVARGWSPTHLAFRFLFQDTATLTIKSDRLNGTGNVFAIGGGVELAVHAPPQSVQVTFLDTAFRPPVAVPPVLGLLRVSPTLAFRVAVVPPSGVDVLAFTMPNQQGLIGAHLVFQAGVLSPGRSPRWTCAVDAFVNRP